MAERIFGTVARWHPARGFGFVNGDDGLVHFVHFNSIRNAAGIDELPPGQRLSFEVGVDHRTKRPKALCVDIIGEIPASADADQHHALAEQAFMQADRD
jgi:cold shock protein